jgi:hypothetical protein
VVAALFLLAGAALYGVAFLVGDLTPVGLLVTMLATVPYAACAILILWRRPVWWGGLVAGLLAWEWLIPPLAFDSTTVANLPRPLWIILVLGNLSALTAQICGTVGAVRARGVTRHRLVRSGVFLVIAVPLSVHSANMFVVSNAVEQMNDGAGSRTAAGLVCALVPVLVALYAPARTLWYAWLAGGTLIAAQNTVLFAAKQLDWPVADQVAEWVMLAVITGVVFLMGRFLPEARVNT